jgi:hypothetical protein
LVTHLFYYGCIDSLNSRFNFGNSACRFGRHLWPCLLAKLKLRHRLVEPEIQMTLDQFTGKRSAGAMQAGKFHSLGARMIEMARCSRYWKWARQSITGLINNLDSISSTVSSATQCLWFMRPVLESAINFTQDSGQSIEHIP